MATPASRAPSLSRAPVDEMQSLRPLHPKVMEVRFGDLDVVTSAPHTLTIEEVVEQLGANPRFGLSGDEVTRRLSESGPNTIEVASEVSAAGWQRVWSWLTPSWVRRW